MVFKIKPCDIGHIIRNDICSKCPTQTYSFEENPTNTTECYSCPIHSTCTDPTIIKADDGYWNINEKSLIIIKCEAEDSCSNNTCTEGYFGYVCHECSADYGKTITRKCEECDEIYLNFHILRSIFKWFILAMLSFYQCNLIMQLEQQNKQRKILSVVNLFIGYSNIIALSSRFQENFTKDYVNFLELQSVFSFLETNLYMIYCIFPNTRDYSFYFIVFIYFLFIVIIEFAFYMITLILGNGIFRFILKRDISDIWKISIKKSFQCY